MIDPAAPPPALAELRAYGWHGPLTAESLPRDMAEQVRVLTLNHWDRTAYFMYTDPGQVPVRRARLAQWQPGVRQALSRARLG